mgnify:CR=1 FL=1
MQVHDCLRYSRLLQMQGCCHGHRLNTLNGSKKKFQGISSPPRRCKRLDPSLLMLAAQMVHEADEQDRLVWHLVAHTMSSLERTVLAHVLAKKDNEGTWIKDVTLYMTQPNRPGVHGCSPSKEEVMN